MEKPKEIEIISSHTDVKESDKKEGIDMYGKKPLGEEEGGYVPRKTAEEIRQEISELKKSLKSTNYVGDKESIEKEIIRLESELKNSPNTKLKTASELAMEGKIAWDKGNKTEKKETKESTEAEINKIKDEIEKRNKRLAELDEEDEKLKKELEKGGYDKDQIENIKNLLAKRKNETEPTTPIEQNIAGKNENKEGKEKYSREELLNAAEIFCKFNRAGYYKNPEGAKVAEEEALKKLKAEHSEREIEAAVKVSGKRNQLSNLKDELKRIEKEHKTAENDPYADSSIVSAKYKQQIQDIKDKILLIDNDYNPLLKELGVSNIDNQLKNLEKYENDADYNKKVQNARLFNLSILQTEKLRYQDAQVATNSAINPKAWDKIKNFFKRGVESKAFQGYAKMGRFTRTALNAAIVGGGTAILWPSAIAAGLGVTSFLAYKTVKGLVGGTFGFGLSKKIFQPMVRGSYGHDEKLTTQDQQGEAVKSAEMSNLEQLAKDKENSEKRAETLEKIFEENIKLCDKYKDRIDKNKKLFKRNNFIIGTLIPGVLGGMGASVLTDWVAGPQVLGILPHHGGGAIKETIPDNHPKGNVTPGESPDLKGEHVLPEVIVTPKTGGSMFDEETLKMATVGKRGIEGVVRDQLEAHPAKFGFNGDINDKLAIHKWSGTKADLIAIDNNYKGGGTETWVKDMGEPGLKGNPAYPIDIDANGKITIHEYFDGKPSGTGGLNSPYEYEHASPTSQRYISALDNTPDMSENTLSLAQENMNQSLHGLVHENLTELSGNIPDYATVLGTTTDKVHSALLDLENTKDIVGNISKLNPEQINLLSKILELQPKLTPDTQAFKNALDTITNSQN